MVENHVSDPFLKQHTTQSA